FSELELHEQKQLLIEILDKNQLYVNVSDMEDSDLNISESDKAKAGTFQFKMDIMSLANVFWKGDGVNTNDKNAYQTIGDTG
ncbi:hypothetical protein ONO57_27180, partial [Salmonella enterica subsp. enterica serovar Anatum]|nr:hypothetical protein [Salmonella enterica subsp. enterica serovar Anatum]